MEVIGRKSSSQLLLRLLWNLLVDLHHHHLLLPKSRQPRRLPHRMTSLRHLQQ
jgi:hypothetical protein